MINIFVRMHSFAKKYGKNDYVLFDKTEIMVDNEVEFKRRRETLHTKHATNIL